MIVDYQRTLEEVERENSVPVCHFMSCRKYVQCMSQFPLYPERDIFKKDLEGEPVLWGYSGTEEGDSFQAPESNWDSKMSQAS